MCRLHTQFSFQTTLRTPLPFHKTCFKGGCGGGGITGVIRRCGCLLLILTVPSHSPSICYLLLRAAIAVCISSTAFLSNVYCVPKRIAPAAVRIVGSISTQRIIPVLILSGWATEPVTKPVAANTYPGIAPPSPCATFVIKDVSDAIAASARFRFYTARK